MGKILLARLKRFPKGLKEGLGGKWGGMDKVLLAKPNPCIVPTIFTGHYVWNMIFVTHPKIIFTRCTFFGSFFFPSITVYNFQGTQIVHE